MFKREIKATHQYTTSEPAAYLIGACSLYYDKNIFQNALKICQSSSDVNTKI